MKILIVGFGLAGLSAAIALAKTGHDVQLVERNIAGDGASIVITNRAVDALEALGVLDACRAEGFVLDGSGSIFSGMRDSHGQLLGEYTQHWNILMICWADGASLLCIKRP